MASYVAGVVCEVLMTSSVASVVREVLMASSVASVVREVLVTSPVAVQSLVHVLQTYRETRCIGLSAARLFPGPLLGFNCLLNFPLAFCGLHSSQSKELSIFLCQQKGMSLISWNTVAGSQCTFLAYVDKNETEDCRDEKKKGTLFLFPPKTDSGSNQDY